MYEQDDPETVTAPPVQFFMPDICDRERHQVERRLFPESKPSEIQLRLTKNYTLEEELGSGGYGTVWKALDHHLDRSVAIKILHAYIGSQEHQDRFEREARALARLSHPNVVQVYESCSDGDDAFIVMEYVRGRTLRQWSREYREGDWREIVNTYIQAGRGLAAAHAANIVHRDFKPANAIIDNEGRVRVLDFGLARTFVEDEEHGDNLDNRAKGQEDVLTQSMTKTGAIMGTPAYMPLEQMRGRRANARSDQFSFCVSLYEALYGERPFQGDTMAALMVSAGEYDVDPPEGSNVPENLSRVLLRGLKPKPQERWGSMEQLLAELQKIVEPRPRWWAPAAAVATVSLGVIMGVYSREEVSWRKVELVDGHTAAARAAVFLPDGSGLVTGGEDGRVLVWDVDREIPSVELVGHRGTVVAVAVDPDGRLIAAGGGDDEGSLTIWSKETNEELFSWRGDRFVNAMAFSSSGNLLAVGTARGTFLLNTQTFTEEKHFTDFGRISGDAASIRFALDDRILMSSSFDQRLLKIEAGMPIAHESDVPGMRFDTCSDGSTAVFLGVRGELSVVDVHEEKIANVSRFENAHFDNGRGISCSPDGTLVATGAEDVALWRVPSLELVARWPTRSLVWDLDFSPDGDTLASSHSDGEVLLWDLETMRAVASMRGHRGRVMSVALDASGVRLASGGEDQSVLVWDLEHGDRVETLRGVGQQIVGIDYALGGDLVSCGRFGRIVKWRRTAKDMVTSTFDVGVGISDCQVSAGGRWLAHSRGIFDLVDGKVNAEFEKELFGVKISKDDVILVGAEVPTHDVSIVRKFEFPSGSPLDSSEIAGHGITAIDLSSDASVMVTGGLEGKVWIWDMESLVVERQIQAHDGRVKDVALDPDAKLVVSAGDDGKVLQWEVDSGQRQAEIGIHPRTVRALSYGPRGDVIVTGGDDGQLRLFRRQVDKRGWYVLFD